MIDISVVPEVADRGVKTKVDRAAYLSNLLKLRGDSAAWLVPLRDGAKAIVEELEIPSTREEAWRFTDLAPILTETWQRVAADTASVEVLAIPEATVRLTFVNGHYRSDLSETTGLPAGAIVSPLSKLTADQSARLQTYLGQQPGLDEVFTALNTASLTDAAIVWLPKNLIVETPIHLAYITTVKGAIAQPRALVVAESASQVTLVESFTSADPKLIHFTNSVTEVVVLDNASVNHSRIQWENPNAFHIGKTVVSQGRDARYVCNAISLGASLSRHNLEIYQQGAQSDTQLYGLSLLEGDRTADTHSLIVFNAPHGTAKQLNKCIADDRSHGVFNGRIYVPKIAQETDASQLSRNLLLSSKARIDTKPELEIVADNVKCAHGATVSQLEEDEVFYLQSRGIDAIAARKLLKFAFAVEVLNKIPVVSLRDRLIALARTKD
jgi:Fe-S cluster assembly protein SufD